MTATISHKGTPEAHDAPTPRTGHHVLLILHAEHDGDDALVELTSRIGEGDHVTLANVRPAPSGAVPPSGIMSDLGMMMYLDMRDANGEYESQLDLRIAARSRLLAELGISHDVLTEHYHRSVLGRVTERSLRKAIGRIARHARADEIIVGPGAILECRSQP